MFFATHFFQIAQVTITQLFQNILEMLFIKGSKLDYLRISYLVNVKKSYRTSFQLKVNLAFLFTLITISNPSNPRKHWFHRASLRTVIGSV